MDVATIAAIAVVAGGVAAVSLRDGRTVILGLAVAAVGSTLVASPLPASLAISARLLGALAAAYLMWAAVSAGRLASAGSAVGPLAEAAAAGAVFIAGYTVGPVRPLPGPLAAQAAGLALVFLAVVPLAGRDVFRMGAATMLLAIGCSLLLAAWSGPTPPLQHLAMAVLLIGIAAATCLLAPTAETRATTEVRAGVETAGGGIVQPGLAARTGLQPQPKAPAPARSSGLAWSIRDSNADPLPGRRRPSERPAMPPEPPAVPEPRSAPQPQTAAPKQPETAASPETPAPGERPRIWTADPLGDEWASWGAPEPPPDDSARKRGTGSE